MYYDDKWEELKPDDAEWLLEYVSPVDGKYTTSIATTKVQKRPIPFYDDVDLVRLTDDGWNKDNLAIYYLVHSGLLYRLNGEGRPIYAVNIEASLKLTEEYVLDYLRFFGFFVRGKEGPFMIIESVDHPALPEDMDEGTRKQLKAVLRPAELEGLNESGAFLSNAPVLYSNVLFTSEFEVSPFGRVEMLDDEPVIANLPFTVNFPIS